MITRYYDGLFDSVLKYGAVASAEEEFMGSESASKEELTLAQSHFSRAKILKDNVQIDLGYAHGQVHNFIGSYAPLFGNCPEASHFLQTAVKIGERLEEMVHDAHIQTSLDMLSERHQRLREERIDTVAE